MENEQTTVETSAEELPKEDNKAIGAEGGRTKVLDYIIVGIIAAIVFVLPIFFTGLAAQGLGFEKVTLFYFLVLIGVVAWVTKGAIQGELGIKRTPLDVPIIATAVVFAVSTALSISTKDSLVGGYGNSAKGLAAVLVFILFYYLVVNNLNTQRIKVVFWSLVASVSVLAVYSFLQLNAWYVLPFDFAQSRSFNPIGSLSNLTMFLVMGLPVLVVAVAQTRRIAPKLGKMPVIALKSVLGAVTLISLLVLAYLNGFTFWPVAIVGIVVVLMFFMSKLITISNNNLLIPLGVFLLLIIFLVLGNFNFVNLNLPSEVSLSRGASWNIAKNSLAENPFFGSGPSTFYYDFSKFKSDSFNSSPLWNVRFDSASGALFELMSTVGGLGTLAVIVLGLIGLSVSFLSLVKNSWKEVDSVLLGLFASFVTAILFGLLFSFNNSLILLSVIISILTVSVALILYPEKFKTLNLSFRASAKYALALAAVFLFVSAGVVVLFTMGLKMYMADAYAKDAMLTGDLNKKISNLDRAIRLAPYQDTYYLNIANHYMAKANQAAVQNKDQTKITSNLSQAIENGKQSVDINPNKASNRESLALVYENASFYTRGALEWAEQHYNKVIELDPKNPTPYLRIALVNMARANAEQNQSEKQYFINEAIKKYDEAIAKKSDMAAAHYGKAIAYEKLNKVDNAIDELKKARLAARNNVDYLFELGRLYFNRGVSQTSLNQEASEQIAERDINPDKEAGTTTEEQLSVEPEQASGGTMQRNQDINNSEQIFLSILSNNPNHANARYSLAVLYQKLGADQKARTQVQKLLNIVNNAQTRQAIQKQFSGIL